MVYANLGPFQLTNVFDYCECISHDLARMVIICQSINYGHSCIFSKIDPLYLHCRTNMWIPSFISYIFDISVSGPNLPRVQAQSNSSYIQI